MALAVEDGQLLNDPGLGGVEVGAVVQVVRAGPVVVELEVFALVAGGLVRLDEVIAFVVGGVVGTLGVLVAVAVPALAPADVGEQAVGLHDVRVVEGTDHALDEFGLDREVPQVAGLLRQALLLLLGRHGLDGRDRVHAAVRVLLLLGPAEPPHLLHPALPLLRPH